MKFHPTSFVAGVLFAAAGIASRERLRPVAVELSALALHLARLGRAVLERQRENVEDLWAEVEQRAHERAHPTAAPRAAHTNGAPATA
jgi:hypothetical protein